LGLLRADEGAARVMQRALGGSASLQAMGLDGGERELYLARCAEGGVSLRASGQTWWLTVSPSGERRPVCLVVGLGRGKDPEGLLERVAGWARPLGALLRGLGREADRAEELAAAQAENRYFREQQRRRYLYKALVVESAAMRALYERLGALVERDEPVLVTGEAGTGKEMIVRALHHLSPRGGGLLVTQRCGEMAPELLDVELFGVCEREGGCADPGAGARPSLFELARGGTLFLQEVERLSPSMQWKLLRVMKEGEFRRLGEECARPAQVRLVLGTRRDLKALVAEGSFRAELYLALKERELAVPPLRERAEDLLPLARTFGELYARRHGLGAPRLGDDVGPALRAWSWPGNVRELMSAVERAVLRGRGATELSAADLGLSATPPDA
jgi:DNA-binding NtrC family response regulator